MGLNTSKAATTELGKHHINMMDTGVGEFNLHITAQNVNKDYVFHTLDTNKGYEARNKNRINRLLEVLPSGVIIIDGQGDVCECNNVAIEMLGEPLLGQRWVDVIERAFESSASIGNDIALKDGRLVQISTSPLDVEPGQIILLNNVTETRELQQKVSHLQRLSAMGEVAARLAHQMRTPLASALLYLAPLMKPDTDQKLKKRFAKSLHASITHMEQLIKDMLAFSRGDMATTAPVAVSDLLAVVEKQFMTNLKAADYKLEIHNSLQNAYVYGSQEALASALNNLLNNARQACGDEGEITIYAECIEDEYGKDIVEISVEDNGIGISAADKEKILKPFYTTRSSGTGLGLAVVNSIAQAHRGDLWFESDEGEGSTFSLRLPKYQSARDFTLQAQSERK
jgi:two-component system sensor histidine kinase FlrB